MRQTWEEIGLDLAESAYTPIGQLDDREITTSLGKRLLMILSPFVFLQLAPHTTAVDPAPGTTLHWVPIAELMPFSDPVPFNAEKQSRPRAPPRPRWSTVTVDASSRLAPRHSTILRLLVRLLIGSMQFPAIVISPSVSSLSAPHATDEKVRDAAHVERGAAPEPTLFRRRRRPSGDLKLWGLSLGMTLDLLAHMAPPAVGKGAGAGVSVRALLPPDSEDMMRVPVVAPSLTSVFPRFSYPDVNFWIW
ncbi:hypothetical protein OBBRIDRAFT_795068 [Obba rivulosa]|uniref:Nudix hydrolase domain-containing protein n=1 Tax=Obba rivulosa TaxID=1052685 RepID=A0A8E2DK81_9APHY|nr:hypothetical protein OBBRIDRAFT_795068 [Obba rivulosa]